MRTLPLFSLAILSACTGATEDLAADSAAPETTPCPPMEALFFDLGDTLVQKGEGDLYAAMPGAVELLDALAARPISLGVITNVPSDWARADLEALLEDPTLLDRFDVVLLSSEASADKPDPLIFTEAVALLPGGPPIERTAFVTEELAHIADAEPPTEGARAAGMVGVLLADGEADPLADHTVAADALTSIATAGWLDCVEVE